jgi:hypothetical protein
MKMSNGWFRLSFFLLVFFVFFFVGHNAQALTISPARIEISGDPGTTVTKEITLLNDSNSGPQTYYVTYANFEAQGETGSPLFVDPVDDLGTWMTTSATSVTLAPNETKNITLSINIPKDAYAGGHFAVVFFGNSPEGGQISVGAKTGTLVLLSVNGNVLEAGGLVSFNTLKHQFFYNSLPVSLEYRWKNDGNDRVQPVGSVTMHDLFYIPIARIDANPVIGNILPHSTRLFNLEWSKQNADLNSVAPTSFIASFFDRATYQWNNFAVGLYFAKLNLAYGAENLHSSKTAMFFVFPWQLLLCLLVLLLIVLFFGRILLKRYNRYIIEKARATKE